METKVGTAMIEAKYQPIAELAVATVEGIRRTGLKIVDLRERYAKVLMPLESNGNHVGIMYAGSLFTLGEFAGGIIFGVTFDYTKFVPLVKEINIKFQSPAMTDVTLEVSMTEEQAEQILKEAEMNGKADFSLELEIKDAKGEIVSVVNGIWQFREIPESMKGIFGSA